MKTNLDTLLTALYVFIDDHVAPRHRIGRPPRLSDAELLCLAVAQVLLGFPSARHWHRFAGSRLRHLFPYLPGQSGYNKRLNTAGPLISQVIGALAGQVPSWHDDLRLIDSTPVPCAASRETVKRSALAGTAGYGYCASHSRFFWGLRLYLLTTAEGMPVTWCLANPKLGEREVVRAMLGRDPHLVRRGQVILGDKGFAGAAFEAFVTDELGAHLVRPDRRGEPARFGRLARVRQWIEAVIDTLKGQLSLEQHGARTEAGVFARTDQRLLALATAIWHNWAINAPIKRSLIAYDH
ncbi:IS982 family transposase [Streptomyces sp. CBMA156]|uniref:IS982 family transposase n=1 Tax=Streptomyces sp. CBMA156 TaxID=1930280 RepID=UPI001661A923|nr:IS982 family transposase [Streptomyces sp. CBMA156]MBD0674598.1 IS982 family transposase [Streptomyces sp. CBMA156]